MPYRAYNIPLESIIIITTSTFIIFITTDKIIYLLDIRLFEIHKTQFHSSMIEYSNNKCILADKRI